MKTFLIVLVGLVVMFGVLGLVEWVVRKKGMTFEAETKKLEDRTKTVMDDAKKAVVAARVETAKAKVRSEAAKEDVGWAGEKKDKGVK